MTLLAACTPPGSRPAPSAIPQTPISVSLPAPIDIDRINSYLNAELPIDYSPLREYLLTQTDLAVVGFAENVIITQCMAQYGLKYPLVDFDAEMRAAQSTDRSEGNSYYGITNLENAKTLGYTPPESDYHSPLEHLPNSSEFNRVLLGENNGNTSGSADSADPDTRTSAGPAIPKGGCRGLAETAVEGHPTKSAEPLANELFGSAWFQAREDPTYKQVEAAWSACMAGKGYQFSSVYDPNEATAAHRASDGKPTRGEIETAVADVTCKQSEDTISGFHQVSAKYEAQALTDNRAALDAERADHAAAMKTAISMITTGDYSTS